MPASWNDPRDRDRAFTDPVAQQMSAIIRRPFWRRTLQPGLVLGEAEARGGSHAAATGLVIPAANPGTTFLRVGMSSSEEILGQGPRTLAEPITQTPIYRVCLLNAILGDIDAQLDIAEAKDILFVLNFGGSPNNYIVNGVFSLSAYKSRVDIWQNHTRVRQATTAKRVVHYIVDEPAHPKFNNTLTPTLCNQMAAHHKAIWPGQTCVTIVRANGTTMSNGWDGQALPPGGWTAVDYGWASFGPQHTPAFTFGPFWAQEKALLAGANLGSIPSLNYLDGGNTTVADGVNPCWDHLNNGSSNGYVIGQSDNLLGKNVRIPCGDPRVTAATNVYSNPAWLRRALTVLAQDPDAPLTLLWQHAELGTISDEFVPLETQPNVVAGLRDAVNIGLARSQSNGWRAIK